MFERNYDRIVLIAISLGLFAPAIPSIGSPSNPAALLLLACLIIGGRTKEIRDLLYGILLVTFLVLIATLAGLYYVEGEYVINIKPFVVFLRIQICYLAIRGANDIAKMQLPLLCIGVSTCAFSVGQFFIPSLTEFTRNYYLAAERITVLESPINSDTLVRIIGPYENPSSVGLISILLLLFTFYLNSQKKIPFISTTFFLVLNILSGILSFSKIFFITLPLLIIQLLSFKQRPALFHLIFVIMIVIIILLIQDQQFFDIAYYAINATGF